MFFKLDGKTLNIKFTYYPDKLQILKPLKYEIYVDNIEYYSFSYKSFDVKTNTIKDGKIFSPYAKFLQTGLEFKKLKTLKTKLKTQKN